MASKAFSVKHVVIQNARKTRCVFVLTLLSASAVCVWLLVSTDADVDKAVS